MADTDSIISKIMLKDDNFLVLQEDCTNRLQAKKYWKFVVGDSSLPPAPITAKDSDAANVKALADWEESDQQVAGFIKSRISYSQSHIYTGCTSAASIWKAIYTAK
jgi:hypothetical protein